MCNELRDEEDYCWGWKCCRCEEPNGRLRKTCRSCGALPCREMKAPRRGVLTTKKVEVRH